MMTRPVARIVENEVENEVKAQHAGGDRTLQFCILLFGVSESSRGTDATITPVLHTIFRALITTLLYSFCSLSDVLIDSMGWTGLLYYYHILLQEA